MMELETFEGHILLYCKGHYQVKDVDFLIGLRRIWAVRCAFDFEYIDKSIDTYIANALYKILKKLEPNKIEYFFELIHNEVGKTYLSTYEGLDTIETLIMFYRSHLWQTTVKENGKKLIKLPKPQKRLFRGIVSGKDKYNDYKLVK